MAKAKKTTAVATVPAPQNNPIRGEILPPLVAKAVGKREASSKFKFTKTAIDRLPAPDPSGKQKLYWADELTGFGLLVSGVSNKKTYVVQHKLDGNTRRVTVGPVNDDVMDLDDARKRAGAILAQFLQGKDPKAERREAARQRAGTITLQGALDSYIVNKKKKGGKELREKTKKDYRAGIERHLKDWLEKPLRGITSKMVLERHAEIQKSTDLGPKKNAKRSVKFTGNATANGVMTALRAVWNFNAKPGRVEDLPANPVRALDTSTMFEVKSRTRLVKNEELPAFYAALNGLASRTARDYLLLLLFTGLRRREAAQLEWAHLDFDARIMHIPENITKTGKPLDLPMTDFICDLLTARRKLGRDGKYVFASRGKHGFIQEPKFFLNEVFKNTGIQVSPHDLRRGYVTIAESADIPYLALKALVNHSVGNGDTTAGYAQLTVDRLREPAQRVADKIKELCGIAGKKKRNPKARPKKQGRASAASRSG